MAFEEKGHDLNQKPTAICFFVEVIVTVHFSSGTFPPAARMTGCIAPDFLCRQVILVLLRYFFLLMFPLFC